MDGVATDQDEKEEREWGDQQSGSSKLKFKMLLGHPRRY